MPDEVNKKSRGRQSEHVKRVFRTLDDALNAECPVDYTPFKVEILGETRYAMASSSANAMRMTAYAVGGKATPISVRELVALLKK